MHQYCRVSKIGGEWEGHEDWVGALVVAKAKAKKQDDTNNRV